MSHSLFRSTAASLAAGCVLVLASCTQEPKASPTASPLTAQAGVNRQTGVAGGVAEEVLTSSAIVTAVDQATRKVTLTGSDGVPFSFTARPEVRNLAQVRVGDKVTATFARRIAIIVRDTPAAQPAAYTSTAARAALGDKPGALVAEEFEVSGTVRNIDATNRTAVIEYSDGVRKTVPIRADVDLSKYKAGDTVTTRVTTSLTILVTAQ